MRGKKLDGKKRWLDKQQQLMKGLVSASREGGEERGGASESRGIEEERYLCKVFTLITLPPLNEETHSPRFPCRHI